MEKQVTSYQRWPRRERLRKPRPPFSSPTEAALPEAGWRHARTLGVMSADRSLIAPRRARVVGQDRRPQRADGAGTSRDTRPLRAPGRPRRRAVTGRAGPPCRTRAQGLLHPPRAAVGLGTAQCLGHSSRQRRRGLTSRYEPGCCLDTIAAHEPPWMHRTSGPGPCRRSRSLPARLRRPVMRLLCSPVLGPFCTGAIRRRRQNRIQPGTRFPLLNLDLHIRWSAQRSGCKCS